MHNTLFLLWDVVNSTAVALLETVSIRNPHELVSAPWPSINPEWTLANSSKATHSHNSLDSDVHTKKKVPYRFCEWFPSGRNARITDKQTQVY